MMLHCMYSRRFETLRVHLKHCFKHLLSLHNLVDSNWFTFFQLFNALWTRFPLTLMSSTQNQILFKCRSGCQLCWFFITYMQYFSVKKLVIHACDIYLSSSGKRSSAVEAAKLLCGYYLMHKSKSFLHQQRPLSWNCSLNHVQMSCNICQCFDWWILWSLWQRLTVFLGWRAENPGWSVSITFNL